MAFKRTVVVIFMAFAGLFLAGGSTRDPERSVEELKLMTTPELVGEARFLCQSIQDNLKFAKEFMALKASRETQQQLDQADRRQASLERVGLVVRDRHQGKMPAWFEQIKQASNKQDCDTAAAAGGWRPKQ
jgi:hypothetical protein